MKRNKKTFQSQTKPESFISVKNGELVNSMSALGELFRMHFRASFAFRLRLIAESVIKARQAFEDARIGICKELGTLNTKDNNYEFEGDNQAEFESRMQRLTEEEIQIPGEKIKLSELGTQNFSAETLMMLDWLITATD